MRSERRGNASGQRTLPRARESTQKHKHGTARGNRRLHPKTWARMLDQSPHQRSPPHQTIMFQPSGCFESRKSEQRGVPKTSPMALRVALIIVAVGTACLPHLQGAKTKKPRPPPLTTVSIDIRCAQLPTRASQDAILDHVWARRWASMILSILSWGPGISSDHFLPARQRFPVPMSEKERRYS